MPKKSKKSKSKRVTLKQKYKVLKKVREHQKKKRRELKKQGKSKKPLKDPGIPAQWPFKEELIKEFAWKRQQILLEEKAKKEERKRLRQERDEEMAAADQPSIGLSALQEKARHDEASFEARKKLKMSTDGRDDQDHTRKAFYKEFKRVVEMADVILQVLDARDPLAYRCPDIEKYIRSVSPQKKIVLLLNKIDLIPREVGEKWLKYFREELPCVAFKSSTQHQQTNLGHGKTSKGKSHKGKRGAQDQAADKDNPQVSSCLGADTLLQLLKNYTRNAGIKTSITVGVVGLPNVGKSSLINSLKRARVAQVGDTPGVTRALQEVHLDKHIKLIDSPGVVFSSSAGDEASVLLRNAVKLERVEDPLKVVSHILKQVPDKQIMKVYKLPAFKDCDDFLQQVALARGKLKKGGVPDMVAAARVVLQDWSDGTIPHYTLPPERGASEFKDAVIVSTWARDFNADEVFAHEANAVIAHLPSMDETGANYVEVPSHGVVEMAIEADEEDEDEEGDGMEHDGEDDGVGTKVSARPLTGAPQTMALYDEDGQYNPHMARAEKKRKKKLAKVDPPPEDEDFDFDEVNEIGGTEVEAMVGSEDEEEIGRAHV